MRFFSILFFLLFTISFQAQNKNEDVLFTVDNDPVYASEFIRVFNKNLDLVKDESQKDIDAYLRLFVDYKLKLKEAKSLGLDTLPKYTRELNNYKRQLAKSHLTDNKVTEALVSEAYERTTNEVQASHILIRLDENAKPADTLEVYNKLMKLRDRVVNEGFEKVQKDVHDGETTFAEDLGYFSGFKMVYEFENAAYNTPVGEISKPFKSSFGYHIVLVHNKRKDRGKRKVAHIMVGLDKEDAEGRIQDIYKKIQQGEDFKSLAKQFSEDKSTANNGGELQPFSGGELRSQEFEDAAFAIDKIGAYTKPFKTSFGWHIVKLLDKIAVPTFEEAKHTLEAKVKKDSRSKLISTSRVNKLKERYTISNADAGLAYFVSILNEDFYKNQWKTPEDFSADKTFFTIENKVITNADFANYLLKSQRRVSKNLSLNDIVQNAYKDFLETSLLTYEEENLEFENEDYAHILGEYRDGLLLFDLMERKIWRAASQDTIAVQEFYDANKENYFYNERVEAVVASSAKKKDINKVAKLLKAGKTVEDIKKEVNTNNEVRVLFTSGTMEANHQALPENLPFKKGVSKIYNHNDSFVVVKVAEVLPKSTMTYEEAKGRVDSDFQDEKEKKWLTSLAEKYVVSINKDVLKAVKNQLNQ
ncbi:peptidylprolyl isomerase [Oceanihabitans sediminis]|uniref:peptidylprolyl isomerase n=1 Tax=Oceanihabitans sediminis TaxID=1812012 RepID=UPI00299DE7B3|nr:peptidylprolyl isomerase [Oceanihabitans sediminis]MDX1774220.1 peptidylprolyl isomerase [Oceanihabitans sediminis]